MDDNAREAFRETLRAAEGIFTPEEGDRLKWDIDRWREEGTRPINRQSDPWLIANDSPIDDKVSN
jgi:hypothetical protein